MGCKKIFIGAIADASQTNNATSGSSCFLLKNAVFFSKKLLII